MIITTVKPDFISQFNNGIGIGDIKSVSSGIEPQYQQMAGRALRLGQVKPATMKGFKAIYCEGGPHDGTYKQVKGYSHITRWCKVQDKATIKEYVDAIREWHEYRFSRFLDTIDSTAKLECWTYCGTYCDQSNPEFDNELKRLAGFNEKE